MRRTFITDADGGQIETTPICVHREDKPQNGAYRCGIRPEVVHCCGQCVSCKDYRSEAVQLTLF